MGEEIDNAAEKRRRPRMNTACGFCVPERDQQISERGIALPYARITRLHVKLDFHSVFPIVSCVLWHGKINVFDLNGRCVKTVVTPAPLLPTLKSGKWLSVQWAGVCWRHRYWNESQPCWVTLAILDPPVIRCVTWTGTSVHVSSAELLQVFRFGRISNKIWPL